MSEDITKKFSDEGKDTSPMLDTILRELREFRERTESRLDRIESMGLETRADVRDLKREVREHFKQLA